MNVWRKEEYVQLRLDYGFLAGSLPITKDFHLHINSSEISNTNGLANTESTSFRKTWIRYISI